MDVAWALYIHRTWMLLPLLSLPLEPNKENRSYNHLGNRHIESV